MSSATPFLSEKNEAMLQRLLYADMCRRTGGDLSERQAQRLMKTVSHYMKEVARVQGGNKSSQALNKEVITVVVPSFLQYIQESEQKRETGSVRSSVSRRPGLGQGQQGERGEDHPAGSAGAAAGGAVAVSPEFADVGSRFSALQSERQLVQQTTPPAPNFRVPLDDEGSPMDAFERMKKEREEEARRVEAAAAAIKKKNGGDTGTSLDSIDASIHVQTTRAQITAQTSAPTDAPGAEEMIAADAFDRGNRAADRIAEEVIAERERKKLEERASVAVPVPADMRPLIVGDIVQLERRNPFDQRQPNANPTLAQSKEERLDLTLPQENVIKDDDVVGYVEKEHNLFLYSADRDWVNPLTTESRYDFSINFDPSNTPAGSRMHAVTTIKFKNITRIEFVKVIMPLEGLQVITKRTAAINAAPLNPTSALTTVNSSTNTNILSFPYLQVKIPELNNNSYGTNQGLNACFAVVQYDAVWSPDGTNSENRGYAAMIPKHMKCQKVYEPTPLATLQKLSVRIEKPDGSIVSGINDVIDVYKIVPSLCASGTFNFGNSFYKDTGNAFSPSSSGLNSSPYYFLQTFVPFTRWSVTPGERIVIKNVSFDISGASAVNAASYVEFINWITRDEGHIVVQVANNTSGTVNDGVDYLGYANFIIIEGAITVPNTAQRVFTSSSANLTAFANTADATSGFANFVGGKTLNSGRALNLSHQIQVALRVITRDLDGATRLRPDNLN